MMELFGDVWLQVQQFNLNNMFTHKIISKEFENGVLVLGVEFTDGVKVITEGVKPQDETGFKYWLKSRLASLNSLNDLEQVTVNTSVDLSDPVDTRSQVEIDRDNWLVKYRLWVRVKNTLIDTGIITAANPKATALLNEVKAGLKAEYIDFI